MKNLRDLLKEDAAAGSTSAVAVAGVRSPLLTAPVSRVVDTPRLKKKNKKLRESLLRKVLFETPKETFKSIDVISKLKSAEKKFNYNKDSVMFGIEDDKGNTIKVYVRSSQASQFEKTISEIIDDPQSEQKEIPEILFNLRTKFEIVHIDWGNIEEDEEVETEEPVTPEVAPEEASLELDDSEESELDTDPEENAKSALDKVIDMMKADADARKAESQAKEAEARAKEAEYAAKAADIKMKAEEEVLDMETFFKDQENQKKESKKLAKLAQYRHSKQQDAEVDAEVDTEVDAEVDVNI